MFKCTINNTVTYTDQPCLGGQRIEVEPSRGVNKYSGKEMTGADVANERGREAFANAIMPLTGMNARQFAVRARRHSLTASAKLECAALDVNSARSEAEERSASEAARPAIERRLLAQRRRFKELGC
jgi:hypothetical protein